MLGFKYKGGVLVASDTLGAYGSTKRYKSVERVRAVGGRTLVGASGEVSDFQSLMTTLDELVTQDFCYDDGCTLTPKEIYSYLCRVMYNRRTKMDPLWNSLVVAGVEKGEPFLGTVGMLGVAFVDDNVATGFGAHLARPLFPCRLSFARSPAAAAGRRGRRRRGPPPTAAGRRGPGTAAGGAARAPRAGTGPGPPPRRTPAPCPGPPPPAQSRPRDVGARHGAPTCDF